MRPPTFYEAKIYLIRGNALREEHGQLKWKNGNKAYPGEIIARAMKEDWKAPPKPRPEEAITTRTKPGFPRVPSSGKAPPEPVKPKCIQAADYIDPIKMRRCIDLKFDSVREFSAVLGCGTTLVWYILRRGYCTKRITIHQIAKALGVDVDKIRA